MSGRVCEGCGTALEGRWQVRFCSRACSAFAAKPEIRRDERGLGGHRIRVTYRARGSRWTCADCDFLEVGELRLARLRSEPCAARAEEAA